MDISGIFFIEEGNTNCIHLYKEGSFWKAYERSAYLFVQHIQAYQTRLRYYKNIDQEIISIGFPDIALPKIFKTIEMHGRAVLRSQTDTCIDIKLEEAVDTHSFQEWKEQTSLTVPPKEPKKSREMTDQPESGHVETRLIASLPTGGMQINYKLDSPPGKPGKSCCRMPGKQPNRQVVYLNRKKERLFFRRPRTIGAVRLTVLRTLGT